MSIFKIEIAFGVQTATIPSLTKTGKPSKVKKETVRVSTITVPVDNDGEVVRKTFKLSGETPNDVLNKVYSNLKNKGWKNDQIKADVSVRVVMSIPEYKAYSDRDTIVKKGRSVFRTFTVVGSGKAIICGDGKLIQIG